MNEQWFYFLMLINVVTLFTYHIIDNGEGKMISMYDSSSLLAVWTSFLLSFESLLR